MLGVVYQHQLDVSSMISKVKIFYLLITLSKENQMGNSNLLQIKIFTNDEFSGFSGNDS